MTDKLQQWLDARKYTPEKMAVARQVLEEVRSGRDVLSAIRRHPLPGGGHVAKHALVAAYRAGLESGEWEEDDHLLARIRMKPMRTLSGVTTVTVLTKPYPCPGECIFCPTDVRMPKSYLPDEPGAARGFQNNFDPYDQVRVRLADYDTLGHPTDKIELLILGGTWSAYRKDYQEWFIRRCFDAMNGTVSPSLVEAHGINETAAHRNVGLVVETRPDRITPQEIAWLRYLGVTKVQIGVQSLDDRIQDLNRRGHSNAETLQAAALLRAAGFKIVVHWMPNLLGATPDSDRADFARLWTAEQGGLGVSPDELKIYPTQLLENAELYAYWLRGEYQPYTTGQLVELIADIKPTVPEYCRINRVIRDIPSTHVVAGNKRTSLRMDIYAELERRGQACRCIRCREVRGRSVSPGQLRLVDQVYYPVHSEEHFLTYVTADDKIAGYLRLSLPATSENTPSVASTPRSEIQAAIPELTAAALIREVHVYGQSLPVGSERPGAAQHSGLGTALLAQADEIARQAGFGRIVVIAAAGTRRYYEARGFQRGELYMVKELGNSGFGSKHL